MTSNSAVYFTQMCGHAKQGGRHVQKKQVWEIDIQKFLWHYCSLYIMIFSEFISRM